MFVANLPFSVTDEALSKIFEGFNIKSAHVVRKHNERRYIANNACSCGINDDFIARDSVLSSSTTQMINKRLSLPLTRSKSRVVSSV